MLCTATSKRTGQPCGANAMTGAHLCYHHGGKTPTGIAAPTYKHGRYSRVLPARLLDRYHAAEADPTRLQLDAEIALLDARLSDLLARVDTGESGALWGALQAKYKELLFYRNDKLKAPQIMTDLGALITQGAADVAAWQEVQDVVQQRRRLVESERKHLIEQQQMIRADEAMALITAIAMSVKTHVSNPAEVARISADLTRLLNSGVQQYVEGERVSG
jgi:monoamine oxidase